MFVRVALAVAISSWALISVQPASADDHAGAEAHGNALWVHGTADQAGPGDQPVVSGDGPDGVWHHEPVCALGGDQTCDQVAYCDDGSIQMYVWFQTTDGQTLGSGSSCPQDVPADALPEVTPGLVLAALRRIDLPASELVVQPPGGRTLVNFETNFYTENGELTRVVNLLGQRVELQIWPSSYGWRFGDGATRQTTEGGSPYPDLEITHRYLSKGRVAPSVDTTYAAEFRVNGGPWREVAGTVTIPGAAQSLRVVTARPVLVGYR
jgi:hypothetical protein